MVTKDPTLRILYISSTSALATKQLKFIKDILTSPIYRRYWPEMVNLEEGRREKWTETEIAVDHPLRKAEAVRDPTILTAGLTTGITGFHCDIAVLDDVVVGDNAYTEEGRTKVKLQYSFLSSIEGTEASEWVVGTRYHPKDLYKDLSSMQHEIYNQVGEVTGLVQLYEVMERVVEDSGDGSGQFLWPRQQRYDGKWFGFDPTVLAVKRAQYLDKTQYRAQYYNDPNDSSEAAINPSLFQYYEKEYIKRIDGKWFFRGSTRLNVFAAMDFAYSLRKGSDYTAIVVVGIDAHKNYYILDIDRFKTNRIADYFSHLLALYQKWDFRKVRAEVSAAQSIIVNDLKDNYIKKYGLALSVDEHNPTRHLGNKEERMDAALQSRYQNLQMWHYRGGNCQVLEEELVLQNPPHDDVKDCLTSCLEICVAPSPVNRAYETPGSGNVIKFSRFGGIS